MASLIHTLLTRGDPAAVNSGILAGSIVTADQNNDKNNHQSTRGKIIGIAIAAVLLIALIVFAICWDRSRKRKAKQGTKLVQTGREGDEEARPMVMGQDGTEGGAYYPPQGEGIRYPPQAEGIYNGGGYAQGPVQAGQRGEEFYRNQ